MDKGKEKIPPIESIIFIILKNGQVLIERRIKDEHVLNLLVIPGGHVEDCDKAEEDYYKAAAIREAKEETGIVVTSLKKVTSIEHVIPGEKLYFSVVYLINEWQGEVENMEPGKTEHLWLSWDEAERQLPFEASRLALKKAKESIECS